jgi:hypothetical protein
LAKEPLHDLLFFRSEAVLNRKHPKSPEFTFQAHSVFFGGQYRVLTLKPPQVLFRKMVVVCK